MTFELLEKTVDRKSITEKKSFKEKFGKYGKYAFTVWIIYHCIKGALTTTFIWAPLLYLYFTK